MESVFFNLVISVAVLSLPILLYCYFTLSVFALRKAKSLKLQALVDKGVPFAKPAFRILERIDQYIFRSQAGAFVAALVTGWYGLAKFRLAIDQALIKLIPGLFSTPGESILLNAVVGFLVLSIVTILTFSLYQVGKAIVSANPERILCLLVIPTYLATKLFSPITYWPDRLGSLVIKRFGLRTPIERELAVSSEEMEELVDHSLEAGRLEESKGEIIQGVLMLSKTMVHEVMVPRTDIVWINEHARMEELVELIKNERFSRLLVVGRDLDDVKGVLLAKDLIQFLGQTFEDFNLRKLIRLPLFLPASKAADDALRELKSKGVHFAVVLDEHGGVDGIVTMEDLIEEVVGEIFDEFDVPSEEQLIKEVGENELLVDGRVLIDDLNLEYDLDLQTGEYTTLAGLIFHHLGRIPISGEAVLIGKISLTVEELDNNRIVSVRIRSGSSVPESHGLEKIEESPRVAKLYKSETKHTSKESNEWEPESSDQPRIRAAGSE